MKLSVITITCRSNPRLEEAARSLAHSLGCAPGDMSVEWIIVDELEREAPQLVGDYDHLCKLATGHLLEICVVPPLPSNCRRAGTEKSPAHNSARSAGLVLASGDYVVLLNDCNVVTYGFMSVMYDCHKQGVGFSAKTKELADLAVPLDGHVAYRDHHDLLRPIPTKTATGACWGAPMAAFRAIRGFDRSYDGEHYGDDLDAILRLSRVGITFVSTERCFTLQLRRTKIAEEITTRKDVRKGERNHKLINQLERERERIHPLWAADEEQPAPKPVEPPAPAPVVDAGPKRPPWKRNPPVVGGGRRPNQSPNQPRRPVAAAPAPASTASHPPREQAAAPAVTPAPAGNSNDFDLGQLGDTSELDAAIDDLGDLS